VHLHPPIFSLEIDLLDFKLPEMHMLEDVAKTARTNDAEFGGKRAPDSPRVHIYALTQ